MKTIDLFLFDLDGTLIDSKRDIADSVNYTMKTLGLPLLENETIYEFVGNGVTPLIKKSVEAAGGCDFPHALKVFLEYYDQHLLDTTLPFRGILEILQHFKDKQKIVLTNKSQGFSQKILRGLKMDHYFEEIFGGDTSFPKKPAPDIVYHLLKIFGISPNQAVMIGDSRVDMETGRNAGILTCGVTYGFRPRQELEEFKPDELIEKPADLLKIFS